MSKQSIKMVNMTSTEIFKLQAANIYSRLRHLNTAKDANVQFMPTHLGGTFGQKDLIDSKSIMRQTRVTQ